MASNVIPAHRPHDQLRMEAPRQKDHTDKYVTAMVSGESGVDMSFRNPILPKSADHFKVGIDDFTANLSSLSMLEYGANDVLFRIIRRGYHAANAAPGNGEVLVAEPYFQMHDGPAGSIEKWRDAFSFKVDRTYNTMLEVLDRCSQVATAVGTYIRDVGLMNLLGVNLWTLEWPEVGNAALPQHWNTSVSPSVRTGSCGFPVTEYSGQTLQSRSRSKSIGRFCSEIRTSVT